MAPAWTGDHPEQDVSRSCLFSHAGDGQFGRSHASRSESDRPHRPSAEELLHRVAMVARREAQVVEQQLCRNDIQLIRGEASFLDPHSLVVASAEGRRTVTAANILIAVGTYPASLPACRSMETSS